MLRFKSIDKTGTSFSHTCSRSRLREVTACGGGGSSEVRESVHGGVGIIGHIASAKTYQNLPVLMYCILTI